MTNPEIPDKYRLPITGEGLNLMDVRNPAIWIWRTLGPTKVKQWELYLAPDHNNSVVWKMKAVFDSGTGPETYDLNLVYTSSEGCTLGYAAAIVTRLGPHYSSLAAVIRTALNETARKEPNP